MLSHLRPAIVMMAAMTLVTGVAYPLAVTAVAQLAPHPANGSLLTGAGGRVIGSALIGQAFTRAEYLHGRPSAAGAGYDPTASGGSNYGPMDPKLADRIKGDAAAIAKDAAAHGNASPVIPADAVAASGSGLDPDISPAFAALQAPRIAAARHAKLSDIQAVIGAHTQARTLAILGEPRVNVLLVNRALDQQLPVDRR